MSEHIEQYFGIGVGVDVTQVVLEQFTFQLFGIRQIAIVGERDAVRRVHVERLRFGM